MSTPPAAEAVIAQIRGAFASTPRPPDAFLSGSRDGCEPEEATAPFRGQDWASLRPSMLDANYTALSFFSEGGFRYFLPAYVIADVRGQLQTADPLFHLTHGFHSFEVSVEAGGRSWIRRNGGDSLLNPRRYGAIAWRDHARFRLSVFSREEAGAIVGYLRWRADVHPQDRACVESALDDFWLAREREAPTSAQLEAHLAEETGFVRAIEGDRDQGT